MRRWESAFKERSLVDIIQGGIGENVEGALVSHLAADEELIATQRKCDEHLEALRAISENPELPKEVTDKICRHAMELDDVAHNGKIQAAHAMFNLLVGYFLPRIPYPFAGLGLFPEVKQK